MKEITFLITPFFLFFLTVLVDSLSVKTNLSQYSDKYNISY